MASQNLPGIAALRGAGYDAPISPAIGVTGLVTALLAPFGCYSISLAAITAAICMGKEVDPDPGKRYTASTLAGIFYMIFGLLGVTVVGLLAALPQELIQAIAGLALLGTIGNSLSMALHDETQREPALVAFLVTLSGLTLAGIGSAFWGVVAGLLTWMCLRWRC
jgi:benzoate membrane transport protein